MAIKSGDEFDVMKYLDEQIIVLRESIDKIKRDKWGKEHFSSEFIKAIDTFRYGNKYPAKRKDIIEFLISAYLRYILKNHVSKIQLEGCKCPKDIFKLWNLLKAGPRVYDCIWSEAMFGRKEKPFYVSIRKKIK